jgi:hypothetical protein
MTSDLKVESNRRNAKKSTGPKTARGKGHSRYNAVTTGGYAMGLIHGENFRAYEKLKADIHERFSPVGMFEEILVEQIARTTWRLPRVKAAETAHIEKALLHKIFEDVVKPMSAEEWDALKEDEADIPRHKDEIILDLRDKLLGAAYNTGAILLEALAPAREGPPLERLDRQQRTAMRGLRALYDFLSEVQSDRLTLVPNQSE